MDTPLTPTDYFLLTIVATLFYYVMVHKHKRDKLLDVFPGPVRLPIVGHIVDIVLTRGKDVIRMMTRWCDEYGDVVKIFGGTSRGLVVTKVEHVEKVLANGMGFECCWDGGWKSSRRNPVTAFPNVEQYVLVVNLECYKLVEMLKREIRSVPFDVAPYVCNCVLDIMSGTVMGKSMRCQDGESLEYSRCVREVVEMRRSRGCRPYLWEIGFGSGRVGVLDGVRWVTDNVINERKKGGRVTGFGTNVQTVLDSLIDVQCRVGEVELSDEDIREEALAVLFERYEATCSLVLGAVCALVCFPHVQDKLRDELAGIFGDDKIRAVTLEDVRKMSYLKCFVREVARMYGRIPFLHRHVAEEFEIEDNVRVPGDVMLCLFVHHIHRNPKYFSEPEVFKPERFSDGVDRFVYVPFSEGVVIGEVVVANLVRSFVVGGSGVGGNGGGGGVSVLLEGV